VRQAIRELPDDYLALGKAERQVKGQLAVKLTPEPSIPIHATAMALQFELGEWAEAALVLVRERLNLDAAKCMRQKLRGYPINNWPVIQHANRVLVSNLDLLLDSSAKPVRVWSVNAWDTKVLDGVAVALKMQRAHAKVKGVLGESNPRRRLTMPCPVVDCGMPTLGINNGETDVTCTSCGGRWTEAEYEWLAGMLVGSTSEKEIKMLQWLLAEKIWENGQLSEKLSQISKLANLGDELKAYDAATFAVLVNEILDGS
jgi:hypothetical protein